MHSQSNNSIRATAEFWKNKTGKAVSEEEAREMHANLSGFFAVLLEWDARERKCSPEE